MDAGKLIKIGALAAAPAAKNKLDKTRKGTGDPTVKALADLSYDGVSLFQASQGFVAFFGCGVLLSFITYYNVSAPDSFDAFVAGANTSYETNKELFSFTGGPISFDLLRMLYAIIVFPIAAFIFSLIFGGLGSLWLFILAFRYMTDSIRGASLFVRLFVGFVMVIMAICLIDLLPMSLMGLKFSIPLMLAVSNFTYGGICYFFMLLITLAMLVFFIFDIINFIFTLLFGIKLYDLI